MTALLAVLGAVLCACTVSSEIAPQPDFNVQQVTGKWFLIGFATNAQWFINHRSSMKMGTAKITPTADGDLNISYAGLTPGGSCWRINSMAKKADVPGKFTYTSQRWGSENEMTIVEVKYNKYAMIHMISTKGGVPTIINKLYGRGAELSSDVLEKFRIFSLKTGILPENIAVLPKNGECPAA
ncbi:lipocalin [Thalassophryne amazonica]|uniref:lipocalin n=1 Tax=Thalassophryne amazonica TaxID=390379 RepID=UPI0014724ED3|nr:lipocalin [Thalassophryne amazonica]